MRSLMSVCKRRAFLESLYMKNIADNLLANHDRNSNFMSRWVFLTVNDPK